MRLQDYDLDNEDYYYAIMDHLEEPIYCDQCSAELGINDECPGGCPQLEAA